MNNFQNSSFSTSKPDELIKGSKRPRSAERKSGRDHGKILLGGVRGNRKTPELPLHSSWLRKGGTYSIRGKGRESQVDGCAPERAAFPPMVVIQGKRPLEAALPRNWHREKAKVENPIGLQEKRGSPSRNAPSRQPYVCGFRSGRTVVLRPIQKRTIKEERCKRWGGWGQTFFQALPPH